MSLQKRLLMAMFAIVGMLNLETAVATAPDVVPDLEFWFAGSGSEIELLKTAILHTCTTDSFYSTGIDFFYDDNNPVKPGASQSAVFCTVTGGGWGLSSIYKVLFHIRTEGGSAMGVLPVVNRTPLEYMLVHKDNCTETVNGSHVWHCTYPTLYPGTHIPDAGISDVEPGMFVAPNVPPGFTPWDAANASKLITNTPTGVVFGITVTVKLRNALQEARFGKGTACVGNETEACMPSLSREQIASHF